MMKYIIHFSELHRDLDIISPLAPSAFVHIDHICFVYQVPGINYSTYSNFSGSRKA